MSFYVHNRATKLHNAQYLFLAARHYASQKCGNLICHSTLLSLSCNWLIAIFRVRSHDCDVVLFDQLHLQMSTVSNRHFVFTNNTVSSHRDLCSCKTRRDLCNVDVEHGNSPFDSSVEDVIEERGNLPRKRIISRRLFLLIGLEMYFFRRVENDIDNF